MIGMAMGRSFALNVAAAAAGLGSTLFITWYFGLAEFAYYTINLAKIGLVALVTELLPSSFTIFRLQEDETFADAVPVIYAMFALCGAALTSALIVLGLMNHWSWFMLLFVVSTVLQRYFDTQAQAGGRVGAFFWIPASSNVSRLVLLALLSQLGLSIADVLWASLAAGSLIGQIVMISSFPEFLDRSAYRRPLGKIAYLWSLRGLYYPYYLNSVLKRVKETFLPLFCDMVVPSKAEIGRLFVFTRANEAVCGQVRVLEAFMVNRAVRDRLRSIRRRIFFLVAPLSQLAVAVLALVLMYGHGIRPEDVVLALVTGLFIYPYMLEIYWRNDALAAFAPGRVTLSLIAFFAGIAIPPAIAWATGTLSIPILVGIYVLAQMLSALTYKVSRMWQLTKCKSRIA
jgi:hypothetical protein